MKRLLIFICFTMITLHYQNCAKVDASKAFESIDTASSIDTILLETEFETPIDFSVNKKSVAGVTFHFSSSTSIALKGSFKVRNAENFQLTYVPALGFRGVEKALVVAQDRNRDKITFYVIVTVGNPLNSLEPALAIRGSGCIFCHSNINSNIITDYGYGDSYYFGVDRPNVLKWDSGHIYGNRDENLKSLNLSPDKSLIVPEALLPAEISDVISVGNQFKISDYLKFEFAKGQAGPLNVIEKKSIYIGAPTAQDLESAFRLGAGERIKYVKTDLESSMELSGFVDKGSFFQAIGSVTCDGDVVVRGPLYLENLNIDTTNGCRLYVIGSVFMYGPVDYEASENMHNNLQITSTRSINLGLGDLFTSLPLNDTNYADFNSANSCDPKVPQWMYTHGSITRSSIKLRYIDGWSSLSNSVRSEENAARFGQSILSDAQTVEAGVGTLLDGSCRPEGLAVHYERLLLNAPSVQSRYSGNFSGTIIAEISLMSLGKFKFEFDPVFKEVPVLPMLDSKKYLKVSAE